MQSQMSSGEDVEPSEVGNQSHQVSPPPIVSNGHSKPDDGEKEKAEEEVEDEEDEEEDVDFNPFLKETPSPEASSSLSSEIEGVDGDVDSRAYTHVNTNVNSSKISKAQNCDVGDSEHCDEETVMQSTASPELQNPVSWKHNQTKPGSSSKAERGKDGQLNSVKNSMVEDSTNATHFQKPVRHLDDAEDGAICRRTRARYSLASFTLDELEAFLQETDDEDDIQNVDDEEEYRKFLAAVLQGGDGDQQSTQENENGDDEDEDNDADFEIELEEALESDYDEAMIEKRQAEENQVSGRRPETRQNKRQKASAQYERKLLEQTKRPLRPLLPIMPNRPISPITTFNGKTWMPEVHRGCFPPAAVDGSINGFTPYQIGQLHCLIYEHVQLLIQIYSLCVLDHSWPNIASQIQGLILEMLHKRNEAKACKSKPYPDTCFMPPYASSLVLGEVPLSCSTCSNSKASTLNANGICLSPKSHMPDAQNTSSPRRCEHVSNGQFCSSWVPPVNSPVFSIFDVAPLNLVGGYMDDVYAAVQEHRQRYLESSCATTYEKEPLFPLPCTPSMMEANNEAQRCSAPPADCTVSSSVCRPPPKKTLAATLVEKTKKQSVALVPKEIAKLAQRFNSLFNPALFPYKPPPAAVANRVLFTDAEDELLALGLMEFNSDWKAIQQRFLPCKSKHQIFVRQKNRCSSKAPENPIKAVRRMKTSPLIAEEIQSIQEGLKVFKLDWMSIWKFIVPHRDPSLLPRQWRIAHGTQRSYKQDAAKKEKRRIYESERRKRKAMDSTNWQNASDKEECQAEYTGVENCSGDDEIDKADESYVHEGFLADWRPAISMLLSSERPNDMPTEEGSCLKERSNSYMPAVNQPLTGHMQGSPHFLNNSQHPYTMPTCASSASQPTHPVSNLISNASKSHICLRPYRSRKSNNLRIVKLAPDLPPVNLPPSVRIISESALKNNQFGAYSEGNMFSHAAKSLINIRNKSNPMGEVVTKSRSEEPRAVKDKSIAEERSTHTDLQMHPLLFQAPEDGQVPYYPLNGGTGASGSFSFFSGNQPQLNLSLFYSPQQANHSFDSLAKSSTMKDPVSASCGIDFHPLLQKTDETNTELVNGCSTASPSVTPSNPSNGVLVTSMVNCSPFSSRSRPSSSSEKANELDLEIHLSSSSTKENAALGRDAAAHSTNVSASLLNSENATETQDTFHSSGNKFVSGVCASTISNNIIGRYIDDASNLSHPEIVMEQEELSDSDDEVEEHVEFECEEMADSEGEGSGCDQVMEMPDKGVQDSMLRENVTDEDCNSQQWELSTCDNLQDNISLPEGRSSSFLNLGLKCPNKDTSSSWLSLDSSASGRTSHAKPKNESSAKTLAACRLNGPSKPATPCARKVTDQEHVREVPEQLSLGPLSVPTLRKTRKRTSRVNTASNASTSLGNSEKDAKDCG